MSLRAFGAADPGRERADGRGAQGKLVLGADDSQGHRAARQRRLRCVHYCNSYTSTCEWQLTDCVVSFMAEQTLRPSGASSTSTGGTSRARAASSRRSKTRAASRRPSARARRPRRMGAASAPAARWRPAARPRLVRSPGRRHSRHRPARRAPRPRQPLLPRSGAPW